MLGCDGLGGSGGGEDDNDCCKTISFSSGILVCCSPSDELDGRVPYGAFHWETSTLNLMLGLANGINASSGSLSLLDKLLDLLFCAGEQLSELSESVLPLPLLLYVRGGRGGTEGLSTVSSAGCVNMGACSMAYAAEECR